MLTDNNSLDRSPASAEPVANKVVRNFGLDVVRAAAIGLVLIAHYTTAVPACGVLGVELFFVLSGFLIGGILYRTIQNEGQLAFRDVQRFWVRRWMRTLPNYYFFLGVFSAWAITTGEIEWRTFWRYPLFLQNLTSPPVAFYGVSWSLAVEEWFYLLFPLQFFAVYILFGMRPESKRAVFLLCAVFLAILSLALRLSTGTSTGWSSGMRMIVVYRFDALMFGVILAVVRMESVRWWKWLQSLWPVGMVVLMVGTVIAHRAFRDAPPLIPAAWLLTIIPLGCALVLPRTTRLESSSYRWMAAVNYVSQCSYSMYLCHLPILFLLMQGAHDARQGLAGKLLIRMTALLLTLTCAGLLYRYLEKPILDLAPKDRFSPLRHRPMSHHEPAL